MASKSKNKKISELRALSVAQPWATCIISKGKNIENRSWNTKFRGYVAIHASKSIDSERFEYCQDNYKCDLTPDNIDFGAIIGFAEIVDVITKKDITRETKKWFQGDFGFHLKNIIKLKNPVKVNGALGFWKVKGKILNAVLAQLSSSQIKKISRKQIEKQK